MITIKKLTWNNWFSYGEDNNLDVTDSKVIQITGKNGSGKSSIPVIIGEILYGKNAFGKTKNQLFNRYIDKPVLTATLVFDSQGKEYTIKYSRKSTLKLTLLEDGIDISSHSSTNTIKTINNILGFDFKLFWQLIYQSSTIGLEFLTATDTNRKKFLINLFNLDQYLTIHEKFKKISSELTSEVQVLKGKLSTIESWIEKHEKEDLIEKELEEVPKIDKDHIDKLTNLKTQLTNINSTNKKINTNNQYKQILNELDTSILNETTMPIEHDLNDIMEDINKVQKKRTEYNTKIKLLKNKIDNIEKLDNTCPTCTQEVDITFKKKYIWEKSKAIECIIESDIYEEEEYKRLLDIKLKLTENLAKIAKTEETSNELQNLLSKIDDTLPTKIIDEDKLKKEIKELHELIDTVNSSIKLISKRNADVEAHNSRIKVIKEQLNNYIDQLTELKREAQEKEFTINKINIIKKAFSTNGLLNYKIEFLIKDLEHQINTYLEELSNGRFQLLFALNGEKLDIDIIDDGKTIGIEELSAGELARINTSTLLAIRKLMAAISSTKLNILFLDEIMGVLDDEGKEKLIDILNSETELNTFLVSHEFTHPLIPQINIIKENKISRIDNG
jgi:DNA repair exonuclease SbcCD ATPase subunit